MKHKSFLTGLLLLGCFAGPVLAQEKETIQKDGLTLNFSSNDPSFDAGLKNRMIETFFKVYPLLKKEYNPDAATVVSFEIDTAYKGVAATGGAAVVYSPEYFRSYPGDVDVVTHEVMHIVQDYGKNRQPGRTEGPGWLTEGIADYVRYQYGVDNPGANWKLPEFNEKQRYTDSYRTTARFLAWLERHGNRGLVKKLDASLRAQTFTDGMWKKESGKSLNELWKAYSQNPAL